MSPMIDPHWCQRVALAKKATSAPELRRFSLAKLPPMRPLKINSSDLPVRTCNFKEDRDRTCPCPNI